MVKQQDKITRVLHWLFAVFVLVMLSLGVYMTTEYSLYVYQWHKSLGVIFSLIVGARIYWRLRHPWPSSPLQSKFEKLGRKIIHTLLIVLLVAMPVFGLLSSAYSGWSVHLFDIIIVPENLNTEGQVEPINTDIYEFAKLSHKVLAYLFMALIFMHVAAVLKHHFINKDNTLVNMFYDKK